MKSINDLHLIAFDHIVAKDDYVALRYSAEGSHNGEPYQSNQKMILESALIDTLSDVEATGRKAKWTATGLFQLQNGKIKV